MVENNNRGKVSITPERVLIYAFGLGALGGAVYLGVEYIKDRKLQRQDDYTENKPVIIPTGGSGSKSGSSSRNDSFPLKRGSKGTRVVLMQQGLERILGAAVMSSLSKIDGDFGPKTEEALIKAGFPTVVDESTFQRITGGSGSSALPQTGFDARSLATKLNHSSLNRDLSGVLAVLSQLNSTADYSAVGSIFKTLRVPGLNRTIVTDLLDYSFKTDPIAREKIIQEFQRMGLKQSGAGIWSLSGIPGYKDIITLADTFVKDRANNLIRVKKSTILGEEISVANGFTLFKAIDGTLLVVPTKDVRYN